MQLVQINIVGLQSLQTLFQLLQRACAVPFHRLGGENHFIANSGKSTAHFCFTVTIGVGRVIKSDPPIKGMSNNFLRFTGLQTQDRNPTKTEFGYFKSRLSQLLITHQSKPAFH